MSTKDKRFCDMQIHSIFSNGGIHGVKQIMDNLLKNNVSYASITDTNNIESVGKIKKIIKNNPNKYKNLQMINGVEITCSDQNVKHPFKVLFYDFDENSDELNQMLDKINNIKESKNKQNIKAIEDVFHIKFNSLESKELFGFYDDLELESLAKLSLIYTKNSKTLPTISNSKEFLDIVTPLLKEYASEIKRKKLKLDTPEEFLKYKEEGLIYPDISEVLSVAKKASAVVVLAEPYSIKVKDTSDAIKNIKLDSKISNSVDKSMYNSIYLDNQQKYIQYLKNISAESGLKLGINIDVPSLSSARTRSPNNFYFDMSKYYKLIQSWGSNFYGAHKSSIKKIGVNDSGYMGKNLNIIDYIQNNKKYYNKLKFGGTLKDHFEKPKAYYNIPTSKALLDKFNPSKQKNLDINFNKKSTLFEYFKKQSLDVSKRKSIVDNLHKQKRLYSKYYYQIKELSNKGILSKKDLTTTYLCKERMMRASAELKSELSEIKNDKQENFKSFYSKMKTAIHWFEKRAAALSEWSLNLYLLNKEKLEQLDLIDKYKDQQMNNIMHNYRLGCQEYLLKKKKLSKQEKLSFINSIIKDRDKSIKKVKQSIKKRKEEIINEPLSKRKINNKNKKELEV